MYMSIERHEDEEEKGNEMERDREKGRKREADLFFQRTVCVLHLNFLPNLFLKLRLDGVHLLCATTNRQYFLTRDFNISLSLSLSLSLTLCFHFLSLLFLSSQCLSFLFSPFFPRACRRTEKVCRSRWGRTRSN